VRPDIRFLALADFDALGRQGEEAGVCRLQSLLLNEQACLLRVTWLREMGRQARSRFPDLVPRPRPEFLERVLAAVNDPGIIAAWRQGTITFEELEALTRAPRALYLAHCLLLDRQPEPWPADEEDLLTETEILTTNRVEDSETTGPAPAA